MNGNRTFFSTRYENNFNEHIHATFIRISETLQGSNSIKFSSKHANIRGHSEITPITHPLPSSRKHTSPPIWQRHLDSRPGCPRHPNHPCSRPNYITYSGGEKTIIVSKWGKIKFGPEPLPRVDGREVTHLG